jgi:hypothetical protein
MLERDSACLNADDELHVLRKQQFPCQWPVPRVIRSRLLIYWDQMVAIGGVGRLRKFGMVGWRFMLEDTDHLGDLTTMTSQHQRSAMR